MKSIISIHPHDHVLNKKGRNEKHRMMNKSIELKRFKRRA